MILVDRPEMAPGHCMVNLSSEDPGGFIDTLLSPPVVDPRVYISRQAIIDMGRMFDIPSPGEYAELADAVESQAKTIDALTAEVKDLERDVLSAEWTLERQFATKIQNKPGRPRKDKVPV